MSPPSIPDRYLVWLSGALLAVLTAASLLLRPLAPIDETRYVSVAWEMWLRGDFWVPFKNGETYSHKPPFLFWMIHAGWALFGVSEWWPRLISPLFAAGCLALTGRLAHQLWPACSGCAGRAMLILSSCLLWMVFSGALMFDVLLTFWVLLGMLGVLTAAAGHARGWGLLGVAIGLGALTKGPVILLDVLPVALLAGWWQRERMQSSLRGFGGLLLAVLLGAVIALAWAVPAGRMGGEAYQQAIFWGQTAHRMVDSFAHERPVWWYLPLLPLLLFPWLVWPGVWRALMQLRRAGFDSGIRFTLAWMLPVLAILSFISGKQPHYLVPLLPAFALLLARLLTGSSYTRSGLPALGAALLAAVLIVAASGGLARLNGEVAALPPLWPGLLLLLLALASWLAGRRGWPALPNLSLLAVASVVLVQVALLHSIVPMFDLKPMAQAIRVEQQAGHTVAHLGKYHAQYQFLGRLEQPLVELGDRDPRRAWLSAHPAAYAVMYREGFDDTGHADAITARHRQAYRGGVALMVDARTALILLDEKRNAR